MKLKILIFSFLFVCLMIGLFAKNGLFVIVPQPIEVRQFIFIVVTVVSLLTLVFLHLYHKGRKAIYLFFLTYPFLSQTVHYINISASFLIITPSFLFLLIHFFLSKEKPITRSLLLLLLFCLSTLLSVIYARNVNLAFAFFFLAVGSFAIASLVFYTEVVKSENPLAFIRGVVLSILSGSALYLLVEVAAFGLRPQHISLILMRRWDLLPMGRFISGGYREPAGLGFVFSLLFFVLVFLIQSRFIKRSRQQQILNLIALLFLIGVILIVGTRSALLNLVNILLCFWLLSKLFGKTLVKIKARYIFALLALSAVGAYLLLPRTIFTARSTPLPPSIEPTYINILGHTFQVVGSTADYIRHTQNSLNDFLHKPLGSGPLNATPISDAESEQGGFAAGYYYSIFSNIIVIGATFGWLSVIIWLLFIILITLELYSYRRIQASYQQLLSMALVLAATLWASVLPGSPLLGPGLNWGNFDRFLPISPTTSGLPAEYTSILSGFVIGCLIGLTRKLREHRLGLTVSKVRSVSINPPLIGSFTIEEAA